MVSHTKSRPFPAPPGQPTYSSVPNPSFSPDPAPGTYSDPYASLGQRNLPENAFLSPEVDDTQVFRRNSDYMPAPSVISRDSVRDSLFVPGTPNSGDRSSWGSGTGLAAAAGGIAGAEVNISLSRLPC